MKKIELLLIWLYIEKLSHDLFLRKFNQKYGIVVHLVISLVMHAYFTHDCISVNYSILVTNLIKSSDFSDIFHNIQCLYDMSHTTVCLHGMSCKH